MVEHNTDDDRNKQLVTTDSKRKIFLSYGRGDDEEFVAKLNHDLKRSDFMTWYDRENLLSRGMKFTDEIARAIEQSDYLLMFVGPHAANSEWVTREWLHALKHCIPVIPLIVIGEGTIGELLAPFPHAIQTANALDCRGRDTAYEGIFNKIVQFVSSAPLPLTVPRGARTLPPYYIERPQYLDAVKTQLAIGDPTLPTRTRIASITSQQEVAALQGIGGIGKTTLALAVCADCDVRRTFDYIFFLEVGPNLKPDATPALMQVVGKALDAGAPDYHNLNIARTHLSAVLAGKRTLIVLDDVWEEGIVEQFSFSGMDCRLLVTTRSKALLDEATAVNRLSEPEALALMANVLAQAADTLPAACVQIANILEGHTLAVQIAAAWLRKYGLARAEQYARDLQTANALDYLQLSEKDKNKNVARSLELSYNALDKADQARFRALGIFEANSSFDDAALAALWGMDTADIQMLYAVGRLLDAALLMKADPTSTSRGGDGQRYTIHPLLRAYARALLRREEEFDDAAQRHFAWYARLHGADRDHTNTDYLQSITLDFENLREALLWGFVAQPQAACDLLSTLHNYLRVYAAPAVWRELLDKALPAAENADYAAGLANTLRALGDLSVYEAALPQARGFYERALPIYETIGSRLGLANTLKALGDLSVYEAALPQARGFYERALPIYETIGDRLGLANTYSSLGRLAFVEKAHQIALEFFTKAIALCEEIGDQYTQSITIVYRTDVLIALGDYQSALKGLLQALTFFNERHITDAIRITINSIRSMKQQIGEKSFAAAWLAVTGDPQQPHWL